MYKRQASGEIPIYMLPLNAPSRYNVIIQELDKPPSQPEGVGDRGVSGMGVTVDGSESDSEVCGIVGRKEYEESIYNRKAKEWADSMIVTPHSHPIMSSSRRKRAGAGSSYESPKSVGQKTKSSFKIRSVDHSSENPTAEPSKPISPEPSERQPPISYESCQTQPPISHEPSEP